VEMTNELAVDTNGASDDTHDILGQCTGLVCANDGGIRHGLAGAEDADEEIFLRHAFRSECEREGDREGKTYNCVSNKPGKDGERAHLQEWRRQRG